MVQAWSGTVYVFVGEDRSPASIKDLNEYMPIDGRMLYQPVDKQMFDNVSFINRDNNELGIRLGHFLIRDANGHRQFACRAQSKPGVFDRVELSFQGEGVSDNGDIPKMVIDSNCATEDELSSLSPIWLPMSDIYHSQPSSQDLKFPEIGGTAIHLENLAARWPDKWTLVRVRLYHSDSGAPALLLQPTRSGLERGNLSFDWQ